MLSATGDKAGDYYSIVSSVTPHNEAMWGPYVGEHGACRNRIYGFWFGEMYVTTSLLDAEGNVIAKTGYRRGGAGAYVDHLQQLLKD